MRRASSNSTLRRFVVLGLALALGAVALADVASAHKRIYETTLQFKVKEASPGVNQYEGRVVSERSRCEAGRAIHIDAFDTRIASAVSLLNGDWAVTGDSAHPPKGTTLIAFTKGKFLKRSKKHRHKCASDFAEKRAP